MTIVAGAVSCITNDIPFPVVKPHITALEVEGADKVDVNFEKQEVVVSFPETKDIRTVNITSVTYDVENVTSSVELTGVHDLTSPLNFDLTVYDDYKWSICAVRNIPRKFSVVGQIGSTVIDPVNRRVIVSVGKKTNMSKIDVTEFKLGPAGLTSYKLMDMETENVIAEGKDDVIADLLDVDMNQGLYVDVTAFDLTERWRIFAEISEVSLQISNVNPWTRHAFVTAMGVAGQKSGFKYRAVGEEEWLDVPEDDVQTDGGTFTACIKELHPETRYEVMAVCGTEVTPEREFLTASAAPLPNASFEYASLVSGTGYYKFYDPSCDAEEGKYMFWGSGNGEGPEGVNGSANMGIVITILDKESKVDGNQSVCAQTNQMVGILAAGNLFTGQFAGLVGTEGGKVNFGRPWTTRPTALKLYCRYTTSQIDIVDKMPPGVTLTKGVDYDRAQIKVAVGTWDYRKYGGTPDSPVHINTTRPETFVDYSTDPSTIAHGDLIIHHNGYILNAADKETIVTSEWIEYTIPLVYHDMYAIPTHIVISCAASQYGDYFTGCSKSKLWLDKFELVY